MKQSKLICLLNLAGTIKDSITLFIDLPFNWQTSEHDQLGYIASGNNQGELVVSAAQKDNITRTIKVEVNDEF
ncbi:hypothetical protein A6E05_19255 [Aliivibrio sp. 1S165]|uniref:hypothetical protein n=1 Tax=unclassified Aliivibrio TaxID=2645654 RepID=UPI00080EA455|nr:MULTISPECIES: hypothetical protein [unclassified Aliivibrio]OCH14323.1 hypothetical protein A6E05_19255 [Aliivibrio sp. 1S165]OCH34297.1 hypothetical protein A6E06_16420 [Aliivibrio sp. 1S175]